MAGVAAYLPLLLLLLVNCLLVCRGQEDCPFWTLACWGKKGKNEETAQTTSVTETVTELTLEEDKASSTTVDPTFSSNENETLTALLQDEITDFSVSSTSDNTLPPTTEGLSSPNDNSVTTTAEISGRWPKHESELNLAREWLLSQRSDWNWGEETPRAIVALSLARGTPGDNVTADLEYEVLEREFKLMMAGKILQGKISFMETESQMLWVHGLLATCADPANFYGRNVLNNLETSKKPDWNNFYFYLVLCTSKSKRLDSRYVSNLATRIVEEAGSSPLITESLAMALLLLKCLHDQYPHIRHFPDTWEKGLKKLVQIQGDDGGYGFLYTTALALQALQAYNAKDTSVDLQMAIDNAFRNIIKQQNATSGAFRDIIGTHLVLPALAGRTLADLANMSCNETREKGAKNLPTDRRISLHVEYDDISLTINLKALRNSSVLDILNLAARKHFSFTFEKVTINGATFLYSICEKINDPQKGWFWSASLTHRIPVHVKQEHSISHLEDIATYVPGSSFHTLIYRYRKR